MKRIIVFLAALCLLTAMAVPTLAATIEDEVVNLEKNQSIVIWIRWDKEQPDVMFIAPDGTEFDPTAERQGTTTVANGNNMYYIIENAAAGQWKIRYDKKSNTTLDVSVHNYQEGLLIQSFTVGAVSGDELPVQFKVSGSSGQRYNYRISAMINHTGVEKELASGTAEVGQEQSKTLNLSKLSTYDAYLLKLYVWYQDNGADIMDFAFSETFSYTNSKQDADLPDYTVIMQPEDHLVIVDWSGMDRSVQSVLVAIFEDGAKEPATFDEYEPGKQTSVQLGYSPEAKEVAVELSVKRNGVNSAPERRTAKVADFGLSLPVEDSHNSLSLPMGYKNMDKQPVKAVVNGHTTDLVLDGKGSINITLGDDWNTLEVSYADPAGITWQISREIFVDRIAPVLNMSQTYDGMHVSSKNLTVSGEALECNKLTVNGKEVEIGAAGLFSQKVTLMRGANTVTVVATDAVGNETVYTAAVTWGKVAKNQPTDGSQGDAPGSFLAALTADGSYWILGISIVLCLMVVGYALIFWKKEDKK